jgi:hypothetical protein
LNENCNQIRFKLESNLVSNLDPNLESKLESKLDLNLDPQLRGIKNYFYFSIMSPYSFFSLPDELLKSVISEWSNHKSQCCLDTATSAKDCRDMLLRLFSFQPGLFAQKSHPHISSYFKRSNLQINYFLWLQLKQIYLSSLTLPFIHFHTTTSYCRMESIAIVSCCCSYVRKLALIEPYKCCRIWKMFITIIDGCKLLTDLALEVHSAQSILGIITKVQPKIIAQLTILTIYLGEKYTCYASYPKVVNFNLRNLQRLHIFGKWTNESKLYKSLILNLPKTLDCLYIPECSMHPTKFVELMQKYPSLTILNTGVAYYKKKTNEVIYLNSIKNYLHSNMYLLD